MQRTSPADGMFEFGQLIAAFSSKSYNTSLQKSRRDTGEGSTCAEPAHVSVRISAACEFWKREHSP